MFIRIIEKKDKKDNINHSTWYNKNPSGIECIEVASHFNFNLGNVIKYIWRAGLKTDNAIEDLKKALFYLNYEINWRQINETSKNKIRENPKYKKYVEKG